MNDHLNQLQPEEKLLLSLCRIGFSEEQRSEIRNLAVEVRKWDYFTDLANRNGVIALCRSNISDTRIGNYIPERYEGTMHTAYLKNIARNSFIFSRLKEVISLAAEEGIKVVLLKGTALEKTVYGNSGLRQMTDIDLLVKQEDAIRLRNKLLNNDFESAPLISPLFEKHTFPYGKHLPEMYRNGISVELHFRLFDEPGNSVTEAMFRNAYSLQDDKGMFIPDPMLFFLYLVKHLDDHEKEGTSQLRLYADLEAMLSSHPEIINSKLIEKSQQVNLEAALYEKLQILETFWETSLPEWLSVDINNSNHGPDTEKFAWFFRHADEGDPHPKAQRLFKPLSGIPGIFNKILFLAGYIFPSVSYMKYYYKCKTKSGAILYYPVRWAEVFFIHIKALKIKT
jgi:hypothetical protein